MSTKGDASAALCAIAPSASPYWVPFATARSASAFAVLVTFPETAVEITQGQLSEYEHRSDVSGRWLRMNYCPKCGTTVSHTAEFRPGLRTITGGTFDDPTWFTINRHIWVKSKLPWVNIPSGVEVYHEGYVAPLSSATHKHA
jgi:hypothetical protein